MTTKKTPFQEAQTAWQSVLEQLQTEMPRASFDTWVHDTEVSSFDGKVLTISAHNSYARDWLESRLANAVSRLLLGIMNRPVQVRFVVGEGEAEEEVEVEDENEPDEELAVEPVGWLDYDLIVQPHKQVVVKGYLRRLAMEIGPKAIWLYIGFHQAAWMSNTQGGSNSLRSSQVRRFSGLSFGAFWRLMKDPTIQRHLSGLVERLDSPETRQYRRGRDGRPHRAPVRYQVYMTPRLTKADATVIHDRIEALLADGATLPEALEALLAVENTLELLTPSKTTSPSAPSVPGCYTVMDIARKFSGEVLSPEIDKLAQDLHRKIVNCLGDIHLTHYFITQVIPQYHLTPAQAWLVVVARDLAFLNRRTGERRDTVTFKGGYQEMAALVGSSRPKTVQTWLNPEWKSGGRGGDLTIFLQELEILDHTHADLRADTMARAFRVLLDEPLDANGSNRTVANGSHMVVADGSNSGSQMEAIVVANGSHMAVANGSDLGVFQMS